jgi:hypothetical protein
MATTLNEEVQATAVRGQVNVTTRVIDPPTPRERLRLDANTPLLEVLQEGAAAASVVLLPSTAEPLDLLHNFLQHDELGPPILDLEQPVGEFVRSPETTQHFGIELVLAFRVNNRWAVSPSVQQTPRQILALPSINLDPTEYTLYLPGSTEILPLDTPLTITRGMALEAQKDGKYGATDDASY